MGGKRIDEVEKQKRVYQISLMLRRKTISFILQFIALNWGLEKRQAYNYIRLAKKEWGKYFLNVEHAGISYHIAQLRDIKDQAYSKKVVIGRGDDKQIITVADLGLVFEIAKEEAKLMGMYIERKEEGPPGSFAEWMKKQIAEEKEERRKHK
ncbi:hypothetical protein E3V08_02430 [Candidatus Atribacteria bacterium MT.SAG.1]|nr:hypothetical protein E3V08_02430 [Candidatus Atribacteria bacterium MT.SAG.1]